MDKYRYYLFGICQNHPDPPDRVEPMNDLKFLNELELEQLNEIGETPVGEQVKMGIRYDWYVVDVIKRTELLGRDNPTNKLIYEYIKKEKLKEFVES